MLFDIFHELGHFGRREFELKKVIRLFVKRRSDNNSNVKEHCIRFFSKPKAFCVKC